MNSNQFMIMINSIKMLKAEAFFAKSTFNERNFITIFILTFLNSGRRKTILHRCEKRSGGFFDISASIP
jgi:hypothetical protein